MPEQMRQICFRKLFPGEGISFNSQRETFATERMREQETRPAARKITTRGKGGKFRHRGKTTTFILIPKRKKDNSSEVNQRIVSSKPAAKGNHDVNRKKNEKYTPSIFKKKKTKERRREGKICGSGRSVVVYFGWMWGIGGNR